MSSHERTGVRSHTFPHFAEMVEVARVEAEYPTTPFLQRLQAGIYSKWHRCALSVDTKMIDIDWVEFCHQCRVPLLLVEDAFDQGHDEKVATVLTKLARLADIPCVVVLWTPDPSPCSCGPGWMLDACTHGIASLRIRRTHPDIENTYTTITPAQMADRLTRVHTQHRCKDATT